VSIVFFLIPLGLLLVGIAVWAFLWAVDHDQFDDLDKASRSILFDDDLPRASRGEEVDLELPRASRSDDVDLDLSRASRSEDVGADSAPGRG